MDITQAFKQIPIIIRHIYLKSIYVYTIYSEMKLY